MRISDWSSDVCSSDLQDNRATFGQTEARALGGAGTEACEIDAIGDQCAIPAHAIALEVIGVGADETIAGKAAIFGVRCIGWPVAILGHDYLQRLAWRRSSSEARRVGKECVSKCRSRW